MSVRGAWQLGKVMLCVVGTVAVIAWTASALATSAAEEMAAEPGAVMTGPLGVGVPGRSYRFQDPAPWAANDWDVFASKVRSASAASLEQEPLSTAIIAVAESLVGTTYTPGTLEAEGPEELVINFQELDCVTFVETVLAMTRFVRDGGDDLLEDRPAAQASYESHLTELRYRDGMIDGYASRLHYFSEWLTENDAKGLIRVATADLDGVADPQAIDFMSTHPDAYRQLSDPDVLNDIKAMEDRLNSGAARLYIPQDRIAEIAHLIQDGDVIAATSTVEGLDVAHTGLAIWRDGQLHLIHAPLVGEAVQISERTLAERINAIPTQDGIMVARPIF